MKNLLNPLLIAGGSMLTSLFIGCEKKTDTDRFATAIDSKPNIIFIMVDDMGYYDLGCYGSETMVTPNLDTMCREGMKFTNCYSGSTVCAPARSTLMSGYHIGHAPVRGNSGGIPLYPEDVTVAEVLKEAGYVTGGFGKWGIGNQGTDGAAERQGFDIFFGYYNQWHAHTYYTHLFKNSVKVETNGRHTQYPIYEETLKFIRESAESGSPFFCYMPWTPPHAAYEIDENDPAWIHFKDKEWEDHDAKVAAAFNMMVDRQIGDMFALLKELEIDDNTIVFFTSDNGAAKRFDGIHHSCGEMQGHKRSLYEGGIRVPMIVRWPGKIEAGSVSDYPWYFPDVMATLADLADVTEAVPEDTDGISVVPTLLATGTQQEHGYFFWEWYKEFAVRLGNWKAIGTPEKIALYDLNTDIAEKHDLAAEHPEVVSKMKAFMKEAWIEPRSQKDNGKYLGH